MLEKDLEQKISEILERNSRVEADKAWETSWTRRLVLMLSTYIVLGTYMYAVEISRPWINAIVPTFGFMLSTLTLPFFKKIWIKNKKKIGWREMRKWL